MIDPLRISSRENKRMKNLNKLLTSSRFRKESGLFVVEGLRLCNDAADTKMEIAELYYTKSAEEKNTYCVERLKLLAYESFEVEEDILNKISDTQSPQGIICVIKKREVTFELEKGGKYLLLEDVRDPSNLGTIARTAEALGIDGLVLTESCCDRYNPKVLRASMGSLLRIPIKIVDDSSVLLSDSAVDSFAAVPDGQALKINTCDFTNGGIILIGNEANGLKEETINACNNKITIPMKGRAESLNAAAAAAILIYEMMK